MIWQRFFVVGFFRAYPDSFSLIVQNVDFTGKTLGMAEVIKEQALVPIYFREELQVMHWPDSLNLFRIGCLLNCIYIYII